MKKQAKPRRRLPGDRDADAVLDRVIRVDHAGEFGARRIYAGQLAVLGGRAVGPVIRHMARQEDEHLAAFEKLMVERKARPTALHPLWRVAGYALGVGTARLGEKAAMACTVAVEQAIDEHYRKQLDTLATMDEPALRALIAKFRADENEHEATGLRHGAEEAPGYPFLRAAIRAGTKTAIWLSERI
jgi:ubiquinone biosynthesis monooxygenase Coq7